MCLIILLFMIQLRLGTPLHCHIGIVTRHMPLINPSLEHQARQGAKSAGMVSVRMYATGGMFSNH